MTDSTDAFVRDVVPELRDILIAACKLAIATDEMEQLRPVRLAMLAAVTKGEALTARGQSLIDATKTEKG